MLAERLHALADVEHFGLERLTPREGQQLGGELGGAAHGIRDRIDVARRRSSGRFGRRNRSTEVRITVSRLLKSCATPPVSWPSASSRWPCLSASSASIRLADLHRAAAFVAARATGSETTGRWQARQR